MEIRSSLEARREKLPSSSPVRRAARPRTPSQLRPASVARRPASSPFVPLEPPRDPRETVEQFIPRPRSKSAVRLREKLQAELELGSAGIWNITSIEVHGHSLAVEYDAELARSGDIAELAKALSRFPRTWMNGTFAAARRSGDEPLLLRLVAERDMPPETQGQGLAGAYLPESNVLAVNMSVVEWSLSDPEGKGGLEGDMCGEILRGPVLLHWVAVREFAHFIHDVGRRDSELHGFESGRVSEAQMPVTPLRSDCGYFGLRRSRPQETFSEIVTQLVMRGEEAKRAMCEHPRLRPRALPIMGYLDSGLDPYVSTPIF